MACQLWLKNKYIFTEAKKDVIDAHFSMFPAKESITELSWRGFTVFISFRVCWTKWGNLCLNWFTGKETSVYVSAAVQQDWLHDLWSHRFLFIRPDGRLALSCAVLWCSLGSWAVTRSEVNIHGRKHCGLFSRAAAIRRLLGSLVPFFQSPLNMSGHVQAWLQQNWGAWMILFYNRDALER